jgi:uncharacterized protein (UPF0332 family)
MKEALRYLQNAKEILRSAPIEDNIYSDVKPVQEACGVTYLAVLKAIDAYLLKKGVDEKDLPQSVDGYREMLRKYAMVYDGRLLKGFEALYRELHIAGYYRGLLIDVDMVRAALKAAKTFIEKIG